MRQTRRDTRAQKKRLGGAVFYIRFQERVHSLHCADSGSYGARKRKRPVLSLTLVGRREQQASRESVDEEYSACT